MLSEYFTEGIVLDKDVAGDYDARVVLFTKQLGRITARVKSAKKITSKLNGHLEPLAAAEMRVIEQPGGAWYQVVDVLRSRMLPASALPALRLLSAIAPEGAPDPAVWQVLQEAEPRERGILKALGFDPAFASCARCGRKDTLRFFVRDLDYFCEQC